MQIIKYFLAVIIALNLVACASTQNGAQNDPLEGFNRGVYKFNDVADRAVIKPVASAYKTITPSPIRTGFNNFFTNLYSITSVLNNLLQFKFANAFTEAGRFVMNSTFGLAGFVDVAAMDKVPVHKEDFGQTLAHWGMKDSPYLVLPFLGPSTVRDTAGLVFDTITTDPITYTHNIGEIRLHNQLRTAQIINRRADLLDATDIVDDASLDPYAFMRDAYLQRRASLINDGVVQEKSDTDDAAGFEPAEEDMADAAVK